MNENAPLMLSIFGALMLWTGSIISLVIWLTSKFSHLEATFREELDRRREITDAQFAKLTTRIQRLEIRAFGMTPATLAFGDDEGN